MLTASELNQFTGTDNWYRHSLIRSITYTDGVKYMAEKAGAYWLIDEVAIINGPFNEPVSKKLHEQPFQVWDLKRDESGHGADLICQDGNGVVLYRKRIDITDFPLPEIRLYFVDKVILLPSEY